MRLKKSKLAILGGSKTIKSMEPHFVWPLIDKQIERAVIKQLHQTISIYDKSGIFKEFEDAFAKYHQRKYALLCNSGTSAIHSMFVAAGFKEGNEVICHVYTFFATVTPLLFTGAKPILCDIDENGNIDPQEIKKKITPKTKGVIITHMWGIPCKMDEIVEICKENKLLLIEDCSHAHGAEYKEKLVGTFGDLAAWSLQGPKNVSGGEGGILLTDNEEFYYRALLLGHYNKRCKQEIPKNHPLYKYTVTGMVLKYRAHPLAIAVAYEVFKNFNKFLKIKRFFANKIIKELKNLPGISLPPAFFDINIKPSWYGFVFQYRAEELKNLSIEKFFNALQAEGLSEVDRPGSTCPLNLLPLFQNPVELFPICKKNLFSYKPGDFPKAEKFYQNAIKLPIWATKKDLKMVKLYISGIKKVINNLHDLL
jgi:dTDP-4-amino-4,6-dideoxygalactose transaminase